MRATHPPRRSREDPSLARLLELAAAPRKPGRPWPDTDAERIRRLKVAYHFLYAGLTAKQVAAAHGISMWQVYRWTNRVLASLETEADGLRRIIEPDIEPD